MKKSMLLRLTMAVMAVVVFASLAGAATQLLAVNEEGYVKLLTLKDGAFVDADDAGGKVGNGLFEGEEARLQGNGKENRVFQYEEGKFVIVGNAETVVIEDLNEKAVRVSGSIGDSVGTQNGISAVTALNGSPVLLANNAVATVSDDKKNLHRVDISVDVAFVHNDRLYVIGAISADGEKNDFSKYEKVQTEVIGSGSIVSGEGIHELVKVDDDLAYLKNNVWQATGLEGLSADYPPVLPSLVVGDIIFVASNDALLALESKLMGKQIEVQKVFMEHFVAMTAKDDKSFYVIESRDEQLHVGRLSFKRTEKGVIEGNLLSLKDISKDIVGNVGDSFDIFANDEVILVVNQGKKMLAYTADGLEDIQIEDSEKYLSGAIVTVSGSGGDGTGTIIEDGTPLSISAIEDATIREAIVNNSGAGNANAFVDSDKVTKANASNLTQAAQDKMKDELTFDPETQQVNFNRLYDFTASKEGYILIKQAVTASANSRTFFVEKETSTASVAAADDLVDATLLDDKGGKITTSGTSTYVTGGKLSANTTYTLVTASVSNEPEEPKPDDGNTSSGSGGGCNAGFAAISALLALAFIKKSK